MTSSRHVARRRALPRQAPASHNDHPVRSWNLSLVSERILRLPVAVHEQHPLWAQVRHRLHQLAPVRVHRQTEEAHLKSFSI